MSFGQLEQLPEPLRSRVRAALGIREAFTPPPTPSNGATLARRGLAAPKKQTATEQAYNRDRLAGRGQFEALSFRMPGGSRYTPDFYVSPADGSGPEVHEVKGGHRFASQSRAVMAFREAAAAFPEFRFVWAERQRGGGWLMMFDSKPHTRGA